MSGFFGVFSPGGNLDQIAFDQMKYAIHREGYDELDTFLDDHIAMGHLMLRVTPASVYDKQPLKSDCGRYTLVGHFRLDYRDELGDKLGFTQKELELTPDSLLVLKSYQKWGNKCVQHLEGDWAFVLYDKLSSSLFLARDKIGYSSLFYSQYKGHFFFASDLDYLISGMPKVEIDKVQLYLMSLGRNYVTQGRTLYKHVFFLPPSTSIRINKQLRYKNEQIELFNKAVRVKFQFEIDYFLEFRSCFQIALKNKISNKGNVGVFLSGGLDSVLIAKSSDLQFRLNNQLLCSFTRSPIEIEGEFKKDRDEFEVIKKLESGFLKTIFHSSSYTHMQPIDFFEENSEVNSFNPVLTSNTYWIEGIMRDVRDAKIKILLTGQFGNYTLSWDAPSINIIDSFLSLVKSYFTIVEGNLFRQKSILNINKFLSLWQRLFMFWILIKQQKLFFSSRSLRHFLIYRNCFDLGARHYQRGLKYKLHVVDPTADERFMKLCFSFPEQIFNKNSIQKYIYKKSFSNLLGENFFTFSTSNINQSLNFKYKFTSNEQSLSYLNAVINRYANSRIIRIEQLQKHIYSGEGKNRLEVQSDLNAVEILRHISILRIYEKKINFIS
jgi:asparagine synthase (glutamine-hydrolysing)